MKKCPEYLEDRLKKGEQDLFDVLVSCGVNCKNCLLNTEHRGWNEGGFFCEHSGRYASAPELTVCLKWREGRA